jgi:hypothetical protein
MVNPSLAKEALMRFEPEHNPGMMDNFFASLKEKLLSDKWEGESHRNLILTASYIPFANVCSLFSDCSTLCPTWEGREQSVAFLWSRCDKPLALDVLKNLCENDADARVRRATFNTLVRSTSVLNEGVDLFLVGRCFVESQGFLLDPQLHLQKLLDRDVVVNYLNDLAKREKDLEKIKTTIWCLGRSQINNLSAQKTLVEFARNSSEEEVRILSATALAAYPSDLTIRTLDGLVKNDIAKLVRISAIESLNSIGSAKALSGIIFALDDKENSVVERAISILVDWSKKEKRIVLTLLRNLKRVRSKGSILLTLSRIAIVETNHNAQKKICKELSYFKKERNKYIRLEMALALRSYDLALSNEMLQELLNDEDPAIRERAQEYLNEWGIEL